MIELIRREIQRALAGVRQPVRAVLRSIVTSTRVQRVNAEALAGEQLQDIELLQHFGFASALPAGTQLIVIPLGGRTSAAVVVASEHGTYRFKVDAQGEAALYNQWGDVIHLKQDRSIRVVAALKVDMVTPLATFSGNVEVAGNVTVANNLAVTGNSTASGNLTVAGTVTGTTDVVASGKSLKTHTHGGVQTGGGNTGVNN